MGCIHLQIIINVLVRKKKRLLTYDEVWLQMVHACMLLGIGACNYAELVCCYYTVKHYTVNFPQKGDGDVFPY